MKLILKDVRLSFPTLWAPERVAEDSDPAYSASFLMERGSEQEAATKAVIEAGGTEKWGKDWPAIKRQLLAQDRMCLHDGDLKTYDGYAGMSYVSARSKVRPLVVDRRKNPLTEADGVPYAGCYVNASLDVWAMSNQYGKRICATLLGVQFVRDGVAFGGGGGSLNDFDEIAGGTDSAGADDDLPW